MVRGKTVWNVSPLDYPTFAFWYQRQIVAASLQGRNGHSHPLFDGITTRLILETFVEIEQKKAWKTG